MQLKIISFVICIVLTQFVQTQSVPLSEACPQPKPGVISNNLCKPLLDSYGINISVEPALQSSLYTSDINIPPIGLQSPRRLRRSPNEKGPADILFSGCTIKSDSIPTKKGVIIQSSTLPPKFYTRDISKLVMLSSRTLDSPFELFIDDKLVNLTVIGEEPVNPLEGNVHTQGVGIITRCILSRTKLASAVDSNPKVLQKCYGLETKSTNATYVSEGIRSNIDMVVLTHSALLPLPLQNMTLKNDLNLSLPSNPDIIGPDYPLYLVTVPRIYQYIPLSPRNIELLWSNSLKLRIFSHKQPTFKSEFLALLELNRCIAIDIGVIFMTEGFRVDATVENILRNIAAVVSLLYTLHHWKIGRAYVKLGYFCLAIPALLNLELLFPDGQLGKTGYIIFMITLSIFTSTLIWVTKFTAEESRYPKFIFSLGPIVVIGIIALFVGLAPDIYEGQSYKGWISVMSFMTFVCLMTNVCYYSKVWEKNMENHCMKEEI
ncbi:hypothetical protein BKA69DRAFT_1170795 [Paraphysoderma sedebokerense]|nr:hypothetical protein BKA69DRAFT_1170795 [Paraphysoderma sedebokerense]